MQGRVFPRGCNVLEHPSISLGSLSIPCGSGLGCIEGSYPTLFYPLPTTLSLDTYTFDYLMRILALALAA